MHWKSIGAGVLTAAALCGCGSVERNGSIDFESEAMPLSAGDTIYSTREHYVQDVDVSHGRLLLQLVNEKVAFMLLDSCGGAAELTIAIGEGPDDVVSGKIMKTMAGDDALTVCDNNVGKIFRIRTSPAASVAATEDHRIIECAGLCVNDSLIVGHQSGFAEQFRIISGGATTTCRRYLSLPDDVADKFGDKEEYVMSNCLAVNPVANRILSMSYFFDCVAVYDMGGRLLRTNRADADLTKEIGEIIDNGNYVSYCLPCAKSDACYVKVIKYAGNEPAARFLVKLNWDGEALATYQFPEKAIGGFAVDDAGRLYCIVAEVDSGGDEVYSIVRYTL
jgi:hypothetical protein